MTDQLELRLKEVLRKFLVGKPASGMSLHTSLERYRQSIFNSHIGTRISTYLRVIRKYWLTATAYVYIRREPCNFYCKFKSGH